MIPKQTVQQVLEASRVEEVVGEFVQLKKRGVNQIGLCPFHNEKTPSFIVSPAKGIFKCFGCGEAGSSVDFVMKHEHYTFPQAVKWLAKKYNIEIEEEEQTPEQVQAENDRESLFAVTEFAANFFQDSLHNSEKGKAIGLSYFNERGFSDDIIQKFNLGFSSDSWDALSKAALEAGYSKEYIVKAGLAIEKEKGGLYDRFRDRVIFPIHSISGRAVGFGGRILTNDKKKPKYVNSPESLIYDKSNVLFGLYLAKNDIIKHDNCFLVEGYTDVISLYQSGIENVVSSSGTSLTSGQIKLIKRYTPNITILYDGDAAGIKASFRGIDMIVEDGMNVRVVLFPDGEDPDSYARAHNAEELNAFLGESSKDFIHFKADLLNKEAGKDPVKKAQVVREIVQTIAIVPEQLNRLYFIRETSELLGISEEIITNEVAKFRRKDYYKKQGKEEYIPEPTPEKAERQVIKVDEGDIYQERELVRLLLNYANLDFKPFDARIISEEEGISDEEKKEIEDEVLKVAVFIVDELLADDMKLDDAILQSIFEEYVQAFEQDTIPSEQFFVNHADENIRKTVVDLLTQPHVLSPVWLEKHKISTSLETHYEVISRACISSVYSLKIKKIGGMKDKLLKEISEENITESDKEIILNQYRNLDVLQNKLNLGLGRIVVG